ncbi:hypothetical protein GEMRC1_014122 [Eukaryota sp. GEM-RC1]
MVVSTPDDVSLLSSLCGTISEIPSGIAEWQPQHFIDTFATPVLDVANFLAAHSCLLKPLGSALGTLLSTIKEVKINQTQAAVLGSRVLILTNLTFAPFETDPKLLESNLADALHRFSTLCGRVNESLKKYKDSKWLSKTFKRGQFKLEFEQCNQLLDHHCSSLTIGLTGKILEKLTPQKIEAIVQYDDEAFTSLKHGIRCDLMSQLSQLRKEIAVVTEESVKKALEARHQSTKEKITVIEQEQSQQSADNLVQASIFDEHLKIDWETYIPSGQSGVVFAEKGLADVVLKLYHTDSICYEMSREFQILNSLPNVPSLPRVYGVASVLKNGKPKYGIVMERLSEDSLKEKVPRFSSQEKVDVLIAIGQALSACHEAKFLHRDLKPANILFRGRNPVIIDWGSGKNIGKVNMSISLNANRMYTPAWASPELVCNETVYSDTIDVFSFGLIAYFVFTKKSLWQQFEGHPSRDQLIENALKDLEVPEVPHHPDLPECLMSLLTKCLDSNYVYRPSMQQVVSVLESYKGSSAPIDCLSFDNEVLCDYGLELIDDTFIKDRQLKDCLEIYSKVLKHLELCFSKVKTTKFEKVLFLIESIHDLPFSILERKSQVNNLLERRFTAQNDIPVFDVNNNGGDVAGRSTGEAVNCSECQSIASVYCVQCQSSLCDTCSISIHQFKLLKNHERKKLVEPLIATNSSVNNQSIDSQVDVDDVLPPRDQFELPGQKVTSSLILRLLIL